MRTLILFSLFLLLAVPVQAASSAYGGTGMDPNAFHLRLTTEPATVQAGQQVSVMLQLTDAFGAPVAEFEIVHEKKVHVIIIRDDLQKFTHAHPEPGADGILSSIVSFPEGGTYFFHVDFTPRDGKNVTLMAELRVEGSATQAPPLEPFVPGRIQTDDLLTDVSVQEMKGARRVSFDLMGLDATPVSDLEPYLGAMGHLVVVSADGRTYVHAHPVDGGKPNEVMFDVLFPGSGLYKGWGEFKRAGKVLVVPIVLSVGM